MKIRPESGFKSHDNSPNLCCYKAEPPAEGSVCEHRNRKGEVLWV